MMERLKFFDKFPMWAMIGLLFFVIVLYVLSYKPLITAYSSGKVLTLEPKTSHNIPMTITPELVKPN